MSAEAGLPSLNDEGNLTDKRRPWNLERSPRTSMSCGGVRSQPIGVEHVALAVVVGGGAEVLGLSISQVVEISEPTVQWSGWEPIYPKSNQCSNFVEIMWTGSVMMSYETALSMLASPGVDPTVAVTFNLRFPRSPSITTLHLLLFAPCTLALTLYYINPLSCRWNL